MSKVLITTTASNDEFQYYIPLFIYTAKKANPTYDVKVFCHGELRPAVANLLQRMRNEKWVRGNFFVLENQFHDIPKIRKSTLNAMRHILPDSELEGYDYQYITDVDFLMFHHKPTLKAWYVSMAEEAGQPYVAARGPLYRPHRRKVNGGAWKRRFKRIGSGRVFLVLKDWLPKTQKMRDRYRRIAKNDGTDKWDKHSFGAYREYDEVMLYRIMRESNIPTPRLSNKYLTGSGLNNLYRDIHLGDFKFARRAHSARKMGAKLKDDNAAALIKLVADPNWKEIMRVCGRSGTVRQVVRRCKKHCESRVKCL